MTSLPRHLTDFPSLNSLFSFHMSMNRLDYGFEPHRHDFFELSLVIEGSGKEMINHKVHEMKPGTFTFVMPYQIHEIKTNPGQTLRLLNCNFGMGLFTHTNSYRGMNHLLFEVDEKLPSFFQFEDEQYIHIKKIFEEMLEEYKKADLWKNELISAKLVEALIRFDRSRRRQTSYIMDEPKINKPDKVMIWDVIQFIYINYREKLSLPMVSKQFNMSVSSLSELFKKRIGQNFLDFLHDIRIRHACSLLTSTDLNISEIALESGFGSYKTFSRVFRDLKKVSPAEYRKVHGVNENE